MIIRTFQGRLISWLKYKEWISSCRGKSCFVAAFSRMGQPLDHNVQSGAVTALIGATHVGHPAMGGELPLQSSLPFCVPVKPPNPGVLSLILLASPISLLTHELQLTWCIPVAFRQLREFVSHSCGFSHITWVRSVGFEHGISGRPVFFVQPDTDASTISRALPKSVC